MSNPGYHSCRLSWNPRNLMYCFDAESLRLELERYEEVPRRR